MKKLRKVLLFIIFIASFSLASCGILADFTNPNNITKEKTAKTYTISYYLNDELYTTEKFKEDEVLTFPEIDVAENQILGSWMDEEDNFVDDVVLVSYDASYYVRSYDAITVTYVLDTENENAVIKERIVRMNPIKNKELSKEDYELVGWYEDKELTTPFNFNKRYLEDVTLYAKWKKVAWTLYYDYRKTEHVSKIEEFPTGQTMTGYVIEGWYYDDGTRVQIGDVLTEDTRITANWVEDIDGWNVSYDEWLGASYDEEATQQYYDSILVSPEYKQTPYEVSNLIEPDVDVKHYYRSVRLYFDNNINNVSEVCEVEEDERGLVDLNQLNYSIHSNYIEFNVVNVGITTFRIKLTNRKSKIYEIPASTTKEDVSYEMTNFVAEKQDISKNDYYMVPAEVVTYKAPRDAEITVKCENGIKYNEDKYRFEIPYSYVAENKDNLVINYSINLYSEKNHYTISKNCSKALYKVPCSFIPSEAVVPEVISKYEDGNYTQVLSYTFDTELPIEPDKINDLKVLIVIDGVEYTWFKTITLSEDKKTLSLKMFNNLYPKTHDNASIEYEITKSKFWTEGENSFELDLKQTYKFKVNPNNDYLYDIYNFHVGKDGYLYFDATMLNEEYEVLRVYVVFYADDRDKSETVILMTYTQTDDDEFEYDTQYRVYSKKFINGTYDEYSIQGFTIWNMETGEQIKLSGYVGNNGAYFKLK